MSQESFPPDESPRIEDARRQYVELFGSALVMNTYLKIALLGVSVVAVGLLVLNFRTIKKYESLRPLVIRIDDIGRAQAVQYDTLTYQPQGQAPELKYFLTQFVTQHFARMRATVKERYAQSLYFLDAALADATIAQNQRAQTIENFLAGNGDEIEVQVKNVTLDELKTAPYKATVDFEKVHYGQGGRQEKKRETFVAQITFVLRDQITNALVLVNPLGLTITYFRVDQAFQ
ncbi:MAG TPA: VirB8/TrbF family protein [Vicinamibacterales bacterium]|nr:VirB8/TrbF family protein [Vicinamibacterales bacterium]